MPRLVLKLLNGLYDLVAGTLILSTLLFSAYSIWDNAQIYHSALDVQDSIRNYRPAEDNAGPGFEELRAINPDVIAWLTMEGTNIDYPVLQGEDNLEYMNKDVYGNFSLAGSIFLDTRCNPEIEDRYSLIYGHNMDQHLMFGDLALYKEKRFFTEHTTGEILTPTGKQEYKVVAALQIPAGTEEVFNPDLWRDGFVGFPDYLRQSSIWYHPELVDLIEKKPWNVQIVALATCSSSNTNDRTVLIMMRERRDWYPPISNRIETPTDYDSSTVNDEPSGSISGIGTGTGTGSNAAGHGPKRTGDGQDPIFWYRLIGGIVAFIALFETVDRFIRRHREEL